MKTVYAIVIALVASAAYGAEYRVEWMCFSSDWFSWSGTVDTATDVLTVDRFTPSEPVFHAPLVPYDFVWPAVTWELYTEPGAPSGVPPMLRSVPYDIPDDWDGVLDGWGFLPDVGGAELSDAVPGIGFAATQYESQTYAYTDDWRVTNWGRYGDVGEDWYFVQDNGFTARPTRIDVSPVAGDRTVGDVNLDGAFDSSDLVGVFATGLYETGAPAGWPDGDWTADGVFDSSDMVTAFASGSYENLEGSGTASYVPEPSAAVLFVLGAILAIRRRA